MPDRAFAVVGLFRSAQELVDAVPRLKAKGLGSLEAYTPYPVHGLDGALGLRRSPLGGMVFVMGLVGAVAALGLQWWTSSADYPVITGGKALFSWQAFVPILFELMVLFATFTAGLGMLVLLNRLPFFDHPLLGTESIRKITRDRFALSVECTHTLGILGVRPKGEGVDAEGARKALLAAGAESVEVIGMPPAPAPLSALLLLRCAMGLAAACIVAGIMTYWGVKLFPVLPPMVHMLEQPRLNGQAECSFFPDSSGMRPPAAGTVARGHLPYLFKTPEEAGAALFNPLPRTREVLEQGKKVFGIRCAVCHGSTGNGVSHLSAAYGAKPADLRAKTFQAYPDGTMFHVITVGKASMPAYGADIVEDDRWAVIHYVRALQRAQDAREEDLKE